MLSFYDLTCKHLCKSSFPRFLEYFFIKLFYWWLQHRGKLSSYNENRRWETTDTIWGPPHHVLLYHEKKPLGIDLTCINSGLQASHLVRPGHGLTLDAIGTEFHKAFIQSIKNPLIVNMNTLLYNRVFYVFILIILNGPKKLFLPLPLYV